MERADCRKCVFFKVTWEPNFPYACELFGFKGKNMPSATVFGASGEHCGEFRAKNKSSSAEKSGGAGGLTPRKF